MTPRENDPRVKLVEGLPLLNAVAAHQITFADPHRWPTPEDTGQAIRETAARIKVNPHVMEDVLARTIGMTSPQIYTRTYQVAKDPRTWNIDGRLAEFLHALGAWIAEAV